MGTINWKELFPGRWSLVIFLSYMALFVNQGIIVTWSQRDGRYEYNIVIVVLMTELLKLFASIILYCKDNNFVSLYKEVTANRRVLLLYMIPSLLYCIYNNLAFINLATFDPTTYYVLLQLRVVMTGIIFQVVFNRKLSLKQWFSLILLTVGCMMKHIYLNFDSKVLEAKINLNSYIVLVIVQTVCSCLAGVYNEYLLKEQGANINIFVQNVFMYIDSILCNFVIFIFCSTLEDTVPSMSNNADIGILVQPNIVLIMLNNTAIGIITSFFLKNLNSILKTFASALELIFTAVLCWLIFGVPIYLNTIISIAMVSYAVILYTENPVQNIRTKESTKMEEVIY